MTSRLPGATVFTFGYNSWLSQKQGNTFKWVLILLLGWFYKSCCGSCLFHNRAFSFVCLILVASCSWTKFLFHCISPPARWGLLDFNRALLLLRLLRLLTRRLLLAVQIPVGHSRTSTASSRSQWALPDLNSGLQIAVGTAGPQPRLRGRSGHCRTSTASSRSQWALRDLNRELQIPVGTAGPQPRLPDRSGHCRTSTATSRLQWALPDLNGKNVRKDVR